MLFPLCQEVSQNMENLLNGIPYTGILVITIFISGSIDEEHLQNLQEVMYRLSKATFKEIQVSFHGCLGYHIDKTGIYAVKAEVQAVQKAATNVTEMGAYLGLWNMVNFCQIYPSS